jgi:hypothetical protein
MTTEQLDTPALPGKGYYVPMVLGNGVDFCPLDFSGSMSWEEHIKGYVSYWYKKGRPALADPLGIVKVIHNYIADQGPVQYGEFAQRFDPLTAQLHTTVSAYKFAMDVRTLLTDDHTLIERFTITTCEGAVPKLRLALYFAERTYTNKPLRTLTTANRQIAILRDKDGIPFFTYKHGDDFRGIGISSFRVLKGNAKKSASEIFPETGESEINLMVGGLKKGDVLLRVTTVADSLDSPDFEEMVRKTNRNYLAMSWNDIETAHGTAWKRYHRRSRFACDNPAITRQFDLSLYVCKAALHPDGSTVTALAIPNNHAMGTYWDVWFSHRALLSANRIDEAMRIVRFWDLAYPGARALAKKRYAIRGARFAWILGAGGRPLGDADEIYNNIIPVLNIWDQYQFTMDRSILVKRFALLEDCVRFIIGYALKKGRQGYFLKKLIGPEESGKQKKNELLTTVMTLRGIEILKGAGAVLSCPVSADIADAEPALREILRSLETRRGYAPYEAGEVGSWSNVLASLHLPPSERLRKNMDFALGGCQERWGLNIGRATRMRCASFPWVEGIFSWAMLKSGDRRARDYFLNMLRFTNFHGGIAEYIFCYGEPSRDWYVAAHGMFQVALSAFLIRSEGVDSVRLFPVGYDRLPFGGMTADKFRSEGAWLFSIDPASHGMLSITIKNELNEARCLRVHVPGGGCKIYAFEPRQEIRDRFQQKKRR